jgi:hypothetical protein
MAWPRVALVLALLAYGSMEVLSTRSIGRRQLLQSEIQLDPWSALRCATHCTVQHWPSRPNEVLFLHGCAFGQQCA